VDDKLAGLGVFLVQSGRFLLVQKLIAFKVGVKFMIFGATYLNLGATYLIFGAKYLNFGAIYLNFGAKI